MTITKSQLPSSAAYNGIKHSTPLDTFVGDEPIITCIGVGLYQFLTTDVTPYNY